MSHKTCDGVTVDIPDPSHPELHCGRYPDRLWRSKSPVIVHCSCVRAYHLPARRTKQPRGCTKQTCAEKHCLLAPPPLAALANGLNVSVRFEAQDYSEPRCWRFQSFGRSDLPLSMQHNGSWTLARALPLLIECASMQTRQYKAVVINGNVSKAIRALNNHLKEEKLIDKWRASKAYMKPSHQRVVQKKETEHKLNKQKFKTMMYWVMQAKSR